MAPLAKVPVPPFTLETALQKVPAAEDAWNTKDPGKVCLAYTVDTERRNRVDFINGREEVKQFLTKKWEKELDYRLKKELWGFRENRMAVRFEYEWHDDSGQWYPQQLLFSYLLNRGNGKLRAARLLLKIF